MAAARKWIQGAIRRKGALTAKAKRAGMSTQAYARKMKSAPGRTGKQARLAITLGKIRGRRSGVAKTRSARKGARTRARKR